MLFKSKKQKIKEECYDVSYSFIEWLNTRLKVFREDASQTIDLKFHKFEYNKQEYDLGTLLNIMIDISDGLLYEQHYYDYSKDVDEKVDMLLDIFKLTFHYLWW